MGAKMFLITGASGQLGTAVIDILLETLDSERIAVLSRHPDTLNPLMERGVDVRRGDYNDPESLNAALRGVGRLLFISSPDTDQDERFRQHSNVVAAAKANSVDFIVYTSVTRAGEVDTPVAHLHARTEALIQGSGIPSSILRNNMYLDNEIFGDLAPISRALAGHDIINAAGDGRVGWILRQDLAQAAAAVLMQANHANTVYEMSGTPLGYRQLAEALAEVVGHSVGVLQVSRSQYEDMLRESGFDYVEAWGEYQDEIRSGAYDITSNDFEQVVGRPQTEITKALRTLIGQKPFV